jgi:hypothetical protein
MSLRDGYWEATCHHRFGLKPVHGDQLALELAQLEMIVAHRRAIDHAQQHRPARLDLNHLGIAKRAVIGEKSVVFDVIQIGSGGGLRRAGHSRH